MIEEKRQKKIKLPAGSGEVGPGYMMRIIVYPAAAAACPTGPRGTWI
ncbi:hypothetical protein T235_05265 [Tannerella sp. oral taxon BU063 isolate Cell 8/11]|uniref:Uncharacterized protein n=1 Tax=Tannerella sp. oral taxon BU063 isolate Cell 8/11 TaxID=1411915 RepID=W2D138_9BACT|nr:hypothetical protein T235_05265 [Tannerella sp. oral taxon BU063 isolate Cell 8/11]